jgi:hypothetical protein
MWDLWVYRFNVGWWIEERGFDDIRDAAGQIAEFIREHKTEDNYDKFQFAIVPHGKPLALAKQ